MIEQSLIIIKPDGVRRGLIGEIVKRFEQRGLKIVGVKMTHPTKDLLKKHYSAHVDKSFYKSLEKYMSSAPVVVFVVEGVHAIDICRKIRGATEPVKGEPGSITGDFAHGSSAYADKKGTAVANLAHASTSFKEAKEEIGLWFTKDELVKYSRLDEEYHF